MENVTPEIQKLMAQMIEAMYANQGIGLAAPQIGVGKRIIIVETAHETRRAKNESPEEAHRKPFAFLNPRIVKRSASHAVEEEGCLSLPEVFVPVKRAKEVQVVCQTPEGKEVRIQAKGLVARIFQHEVDHLNGTLLINRISPVTRFKIRKFLKKLEKQAKKT